MTDEESEKQTEDTSHTPFIVYAEESPIIRMDVISALAHAYKAYHAAEWQDGKYCPEADVELLPQVFDLTWQAVAEAKEAVRERGIPIDGSREVIYRTKYWRTDGKLIGRGEYIALDRPLPKVCAYYIDCCEEKDTRAISDAITLLNYELIIKGVGALFQEHIGFYGMDDWIKTKQKIQTTHLDKQASDDCDWLRKLAQRQMQSWLEIEESCDKQRNR